MFYVKCKITYLTNILKKIIQNFYNKVNYIGLNDIKNKFPI